MVVTYARILSLNHCIRLSISASPASFNRQQYCIEELILHFRDQSFPAGDADLPVGSLGDVPKRLENYQRLREAVGPIRSWLRCPRRLNTAESLSTDLVPNLRKVL